MSSGDINDTFSDMVEQARREDERRRKARERATQAKAERSLSQRSRAERKAAVRDTQRRRQSRKVLSRQADTIGPAPERGSGLSFQSIGTWFANRGRRRRKRRAPPLVWLVWVMILGAIILGDQSLDPDNRRTSPKPVEVDRMRKIRLEDRPVQIEPVMLPSPRPIVSPQRMRELRGDVPMAMIQIPPRYPIETMKNPISGDVVIEYSVTPSGRIEDVRFIEAPHPAMVGAVEDVLPIWRFHPATRDGEPVRATGQRMMFTFEPTLRQREVMEDRNEDWTPRPNTPTTLPQTIPPAPRLDTDEMRRGAADITVIPAPDD